MKSFIAKILGIAAFIALLIVTQKVYLAYGKEPPKTIVETTRVDYSPYFNSPGAGTSPASDSSTSETTSKVTDRNEIPDEATKVTVVWVSDGDTYIVEMNSKETTIRLIGVDTPESVASDEYLEKSGKQNTAEGKVASTVMKEKLPKGTTIYILPGEQDTDMYGRTLAYAWFEDGTMIEDFLLANGYAEILEIEPNTLYAEHFRSIKEENT